MIISFLPSLLDVLFFHSIDFSHWNKNKGVLLVIMKFQKGSLSIKKNLDFYSWKPCNPGLPYQVGVVFFHGEKMVWLKPWGPSSQNFTLNTSVGRTKSPRSVYRGKLMCCFVRFFVGWLKRIHSQGWFLWSQADVFFFTEYWEDQIWRCGIICAWFGLVIEWYT